MVGPRGRQAGSGLVIAIAALALVASAIAVVSGLLASRRTSHRLVERDIRVEALTDAAFAEALARLADDRDFRGFGPRTFGGGTIEVRVDRERAPVLAIEAVGRWSEWQGLLAAEVLISGTQPRIVQWRRDVERLPVGANE